MFNLNHVHSLLFCASHSSQDLHIECTQNYGSTIHPSSHGYAGWSVSFNTTTTTTTTMSSSLLLLDRKYQRNVFVVASVALLPHKTLRVLSLETTTLLYTYLYGQGTQESFVHVRHSFREEGGGWGDSGRKSNREMQKGTKIIANVSNSELLYRYLGTTSDSLIVCSSGLGWDGVLQENHFLLLLGDWG